MAKKAVDTEVREAPKVSVQSLDSLVSDDKNFNLHTERGAEMLDHSLSQLGAGRSLLIDKDDRLMAGNLTKERALAAGYKDVIVIETDGTTLVAVKRKDISLDDAKGRALALADNRVGEVSTNLDLAAIKTEFERLEIPLEQFYSEYELLSVEELSFVNESEDNESHKPGDKTDADYAKGYLDGSMKKFEFYVVASEYQQFAERLQTIKNDLGVEKNSDVFITLVANYQPK